MDQMKKKTTIIGVGNCGSQIALLAEKLYSPLFDCVYINTSEADLSMVQCATEELKFKIGDDEVEGSAKNRSKMKEYLQENFASIIGNDNFQQAIADKQYCFIISSTAGGTGSGSAPILTEFMSQMFPDTEFVLVAVLPQLGASLMEQGNTAEYLKELYEVLDKDITYMIYDNETVANMPATKALEALNREVVEDIRVLTGVDSYATPFESIDDADMASIVGTPGRLMVVRLKSGLSAKAMEDADLDEMIIKAIKHSKHAETDRNKQVTRWGLITYFTDAVNDLYCPTLSKLQDFIGTPVERFNHNAINPGREDQNFLYLIASGLSPINDRATKISERIEQLQTALAGDDATSYVLSGDASYEAVMARRKEEKRKASGAEIDADSIFQKFMK